MHVLVGLTAWTLFVVILVETLWRRCAQFGLRLLLNGSPLNLPKMIDVYCVSAEVGQDTRKAKIASDNQHVLARQNDRAIGCAQTRISFMFHRVGRRNIHFECVGDDCRNHRSHAAMFCLRELAHQVVCLGDDVRRDDSLRKEIDQTNQQFEIVGGVLPRSIEPWDKRTPESSCCKQDEEIAVDKDALVPVPVDECIRAHDVDSRYRLQNPDLHGLDFSSFSIDSKNPVIAPCAA